MTSSRELWPGRVRAAYAEVLGEDVVLDSSDQSFGAVSVDVPPERWVEALALARDALDCTFFDFLTAVDELDEGFRIVCHLADHRRGGVEHLVVRTLVPREAASLPTAVGVFAGASWHERETHEMFGVDFTAEGVSVPMAPLLLPDEFEGHPLRKEFVLASRVAKAWPGAKEPGESDHAPAAKTSRRRARPPGVPTPGEWGPRTAELSDPQSAGTEPPSDNSAGGPDA